MFYFILLITTLLTVEIASLSASYNSTETFESVTAYCKESQVLGKLNFKLNIFPQGNKNR